MSARSNERLLVTGAAGFLGAHIVRTAVARGLPVRAFVRNESSAAAALPQHERLEVVTGDLTRAADVDAAMDGVTAVIHSAAKVGDGGVRGEFFRANVDATRNVVDACVRHRVARLVHISTPSVVFSGASRLDMDEDEPYPQRFLSYYGESKAAAERLVRASPVDAVVLRPRAIWGAGDANGYFPRLLAALAAGRVPRLVTPAPPLVDFCHVDNAAAAAVLALDAERARGNTYFITDGRPIPFWDWIDRLADTFALRRPSRTVNARTAYAAATVVELAWRALRISREPPLSRYTVRLFAASCTSSIERARRDLGYAPHHDIERGLAELKAWVDRLGGVAGFLAADVDTRRRCTTFTA